MNGKRATASAPDAERQPDVEIREAAPPLSVDLTRWWETPAFRAFAEVRRAFTTPGVPRGESKTTEQAARSVVFWALYEIGHAIDLLAEHERQGQSATARVRFTRFAPGKVSFEIHVSLDEPSSQTAPALSSSAFSERYS